MIDKKLEMLEHYLDAVEGQLKKLNLEIEAFSPEEYTRLMVEKVMQQYVLELERDQLRCVLNHLSERFPTSAKTAAKQRWLELSKQGHPNVCINLRTLDNNPIVSYWSVEDGFMYYEIFANGTWTRYVEYAQRFSSYFNSLMCPSKIFSVQVNSTTGALVFEEIKKTE